MKRDKPAKPEVKEVKAPRRVGSMRFSKCGSFKGFNYGSPVH